MAEQQAVQTKGPGVQAGTGSFPCSSAGILAVCDTPSVCDTLRAVGLVEAPADAGVPDQGAQPADIIPGQAETVPDSPGFQQGQDLGRGHPSREDIQQVEKGPDNGMVGGEGTVGQGPGNPAGLFRRPEDPGNGPVVPFDIRCHDQDIRGQQVGMLLEKFQQPVVEDLHLAQLTVAGVKGDGPVFGPDDKRGSVGVTAVMEIKDILLHRTEQAGCIFLLVEIVFPDRNGTVIDRPEQESKKVPAHPAQGGQQRIALGIEPTDVSLLLPPPVLPFPGQFPAGDHVFPETATGAQMKEMHLGERGHDPEHLEISRGQGADSEKTDPLRQGVKAGPPDPAGREHLCAASPEPVE
ncbi:hypothetical protein GF1_28150 [Desulfolithobacter dissulfuricans]|uniref:Uncharacterized protein n=1 Tax=Desulfolithobacter dissulfuricans TaxID=2795293 RepID=A0A915U317_9BACT|nr:hypothetical protein GF1_28150 [Desulfolithobacter dissulfuricans]